MHISSWLPTAINTERGRSKKQKKYIIVKFRMASTDLGTAVVAINDICRFCKQNMRKAGVLTHSADIFLKFRKPHSISERLARIGLKVVKTTKRSNRVCQRCVTVITRLERDLPVFREWMQEENGVSNAAATEHAEKRDSKSTPFDTLTLEPPSKKFCPSPSLQIPARPAASIERSITQAITWYPSRRRVAKECDPEDAGMVINISNKNWRAAAKHIMKNVQLVDEIKLQILNLVTKECKSLCNPNYNFMLWKTAPEDLKAFSFSSLLSDLSRLSPFLLSVFSAASNHYHPATAAAVAIALRGRQPRLSAFSHHLAGILHKGGARKAVFTRLSKMGITTSHTNALQKLKELKEHTHRPALGQNAMVMNAGGKHHITTDQGENDISRDPTSDSEKLLGEDDLSGEPTSDSEELLGEDDLSDEPTSDSEELQEDDLSGESTSDYEEIIVGVVGERDFCGDSMSDSEDAQREDISGDHISDSEELLGDRDLSVDPTSDSEEPLEEKDNHDDPTNDSEEAQ